MSATDRNGGFDFDDVAYWGDRELRDLHESATASAERRREAEAELERRGFTILRAV